MLHGLEPSAGTANGERRRLAHRLRARQLRRALGAARARRSRRRRLRSARFPVAAQGWWLEPRVARLREIIRSRQTVGRSSRADGRVSARPVPKTSPAVNFPKVAPARHQHRGLLLLDDADGSAYAQAQADQVSATARQVRRQSNHPIVRSRATTDCIVSREA